MESSMLRSTVLALVLVGAVALEAAAMRCNNLLVDIGDTKFEVTEKCGPPAATNFIAVETITTRSPYGSSTDESPIEQWVYDLGRDSLLQIVIFTGGRVTEIKQGGRVIDRPVQGPFTASLGDSQADIQHRYGEPIFRDVVGTETETYRSAPDTVVERAVKVELWVYDFGPGTFLKLLTFRDGRLIKIEDGDRR